MSTAAEELAGIEVLFARPNYDLVTDPDAIDAIQARIDYAALPWWVRLSRRSPAGWARKGER